MEGGCTIIRPGSRNYKIGQEIGFFYMSDLHIGARDCDYNLIDAELKEAVANGDRIAINGDVFDMILPKDHKRFRPTVLHPKISQRDNIIDAAVDMGVEILAPYKDNIDMIGCGNHETSVEKYHSTDVIVRLMEKLGSKTAKYGGYQGFLEYSVRRKGGTGFRFITHYWHGGGGSAPVTKGMIDFHRLRWVGNSDVEWIGHKHNRFNAHERRMVCPKSGSKPVLKDVRHIMTGSYFDTYHGQTQESIARRGRLSNYAADAAMAPQGKGGARVVLKMERNGFRMKVIQ